MKNYYQLSLNGQKEPNSHKAYLIKAIAVSLINLNSEDFENVLGHLGEKLNDAFNTQNTSNVVRIVDFLRFACCEVEINQELKIKFSDFVQKVNIVFKV